MVVATIASPCQKRAVLADTSQPTHIFARLEPTINAAPHPYRATFNPGYGASKAALNAITLAFAIDLEAEGIKVNAVTPGYTATALNNYEGTETVEQGAAEAVRVALLGPEGPSATFTGSVNETYPW
jgi:NAD(P)-dependent dehydrogenase (short-subunit alcohol dehydrogenase family)